MQQLSCIAHEGYPSPTLSWMRNGIPLTESPSVRISWSGLGNNAATAQSLASGQLWSNRTSLNTHPTSELVLHLQPEDDAAEYTCTAQNSAMSQPLQSSVRLSVYCK
jgi:hypothetical protein